MYHSERWSMSERLAELESMFEARVAAHEKLKSGEWVYECEGGMMVTVGVRGSGKGLASAARARKFYMMGLEVWSTPSAGLMFGKFFDPMGGENGEASVYAIGVGGIRFAYVLIDESPSWFNKFDQTTKRGVLSAEVYNGLRKYGVLVELTSQREKQHPEYIRGEAPMVEYPLKNDGDRSHLGFEFKEGVVVWGDVTLNMQDDSTLFGMVAGAAGGGSMKAGAFDYDPDELLAASKVYWTLEEMDVGARFGQDADDVEKLMREGLQRRSDARNERFE